MSEVERGFTILEHPSDLGIEAVGRDLNEAFEEAAAGLMSVILDPSTVGMDEERTIQVAAGDREQLLFRFLSEVLYCYDGQGFASREIRVLRLDDTHLVARMKGELFAADRHASRLDVKAITYHQIAIEEGPEGAKVRIFLDI